MMAWCGAWLVACTEPNPYLDTATESTSTGEASGSSSTTEPEPGSSSSTTATTTTGEDGSSSGEPPLGCTDLGMECVPAPPEGFEGPFAWLEHELVGARPSCPAPFDQPLVEAFSNVSAPAASCMCGCGPFTGANCDAEATLERYGAAACGGGVLATEVLDPTPACNLLPGGGWSGGSLFFDAPAMAGGGCTPQPDVELDPAVFLTRHLACAGTFADMGCGLGELCAPAPEDPLAPRWCVWQAGDVACPEGPYGERSVLYQDIDDGRGCEPCTCSPPTGPCMDALAVFSPNLDCSMPPGGIAADTCVPTAGLVRSVIYNPGTPAGSCTAAVVMPIGDAAGTDPVTFCCTP